jgi:hypothetical protein
VLVGDEAERLADQVHDAGLHLGLREDGLDRFREALQPVDAADQDVADAALLQLAQHGEGVRACARENAAKRPAAVAYSSTGEVTRIKRALLDDGELDAELRGGSSESRSCCVGSASSRC